MSARKTQSAWLFWGLLISGGSALYFWKQLNPGVSLNPTKATADVER